MSLLFPADTLKPLLPERDYQIEFDAAHKAGFSTFIFDFDALSRGEVNYSLRRLPSATTETPLLYRGWMIRREQYTPLYEALLAKNYRLLTTPAAYACTHDFSQSAHIINEYGPPSLTFPGGPGDFDEEHLQVIERTVVEKWPSQALIVKDFVKSQKYAWSEACYIPFLPERNVFQRITRRFLELQGDLLQGGLVYRPFVLLREVGRQPVVDLPLHAEYRAFYWQGQRFWSSPRHPTCDYGALEPDWARFDGLAA